MKYLIILRRSSMGERRTFSESLVVYGIDERSSSSKSEELKDKRKTLM